MLLVLMQCCCITPGMTWYKEQTSEYNQMSRSCASEWDMWLQSLYRRESGGKKSNTANCCATVSTLQKHGFQSFFHSSPSERLNLPLKASHQVFIFSWYVIGGKLSQLFAKSNLFLYFLCFTSCDVITFNHRLVN